MRLAKDLVELSETKRMRHTKAERVVFFRFPFGGFLKKFRFRIFKYLKMSDHNLLFRNSRIEHQSDCNTLCPMDIAVHVLYNTIT